MDALRSVIQPVTHSLPKPIRDIGLGLLGQQCYKTLILDVDLSHIDCLKLGVSKALGIGIIGASSIVKVPQLLKLLNSQSAEGISFLSYLLETSSYLITLAYNVRQGFPFSTYGEIALILVQNVAIAALVLHFSGKTAGSAAWVAGLAAAGYALFDGKIVDKSMMGYLQAGAGLLGVASKVPQILAIWQQGGTGQLSAFAVFNFLAGSLARVFTTLQEVNDPLILYGFLAGFVLNAVLAAQVVYYWNSPSSKATPATKLEKPIMADGGSSGTSSGASAKPKTPTTRRRG